MNPKQAFWRWFWIGLVAGVFLVVAQAMAVGGLAGLLQVGEASALRPVIEADLGEIPLADGPGHDGQIFYAMAVDLGGDEVGPLLDNASYRYRRILFPGVASLFGLLDGWTLLYSMVVVVSLSMAVSSGLVGAMAVRAGRSPMLALVVVLNPGVWLSVQLLTSDALSVALMLAALHAMTVARDRNAPIWFGLSALAKDVSLATPVPLGIGWRDWKLVSLPIAMLLSWVLVLQVRFGAGLTPRGNLDWPLAGLIEASTNWASLDRKEWVYLAIALGSVAAGVVSSFRRSWLRWPIVTWTTLAVISSNWVWDFGNNAVRSFAPLLVLVVLASLYVTAPTPTREVVAVSTS